MHSQFYSLELRSSIKQVTFTIVNFPGYCTVRLRSYAHAHPGCNATDHEYGYIVVNGQFVLTGSFGVVPNYPNYRGVNTMILNPTKCTASDWRQFDTWVNTDGANALVDYLNYLDNGIIILDGILRRFNPESCPRCKAAQTGDTFGYRWLGIWSKIRSGHTKGIPAQNCYRHCSAKLLFTGNCCQNCW